MDLIIKETKKVAITLGVLSIGIVIVTLMLDIFGWGIVWSILYGFVLCLLNFILLGTVVDKALSMPPRQAKRHIQINYAVRFILAGVILAIPFIVDGMNGWCSAVLMLAPKVTYTAIGFYTLIFKREEKDKI